MEIKNLAEFKRFMASPGAALRGLEHWHQDKLKEPFRSRFFEVRRVGKVQSNGVFMEDGSWLIYGPASGWRFEGDKVVKLSSGGQPMLAYQALIVNGGNP